LSIFAFQPRQALIFISTSAYRRAERWAVSQKCFLKQKRAEREGTEKVYQNGNIKMIQCIKMIFAVSKWEYQNGTVYQNDICYIKMGISK